MNDIAPVRAIDFKAEAHRDPWSVPLFEIDVSNPYLYSEDTWPGFFARLRRDDPKGAGFGAQTRVRRCGKPPCLPPPGIPLCGGPVVPKDFHK
jgi:hypothetical protein